MQRRISPNLYVAFLVTFAAAVFITQAHAYPNGVSGASGKSGSTCTMCHSTGTSIPTITISGPLTVTSGSTNTYTLSNNGTPNSGLDVGASAGTFTAGSTTQIMNGEITHMASLTTSPLSWTFSWTAPTVTTSTNVMMYGASISGGAGGSTGSAVVTITVNPAASAPSITSQPANQTVTAGQTATFSVTATGTAPLSYQWRKNSVNITGATSASYTTPATTAADSGSTFSVVVTNSAGSTTSSNGTLTVNAAAVAPSITSQPVNRTVTAGQTATFSVSATGTSPMSYQWMKNGTNIGGAISSSYTTPATTMSDSGSAFSVLISNSAGNVTSNSATLTVNQATATAPSITTQPANQTVTAGQAATFSVLATGTGPLSYQWRMNGTNISGANASSYTTQATTAANSGSMFSVVISNSAGSVTSSNARLTVNTAPTGGSGGLVLSTNRLVFYSEASGTLSPKRVRVTTSNGSPTGFTADVYGGSWISIDPSAGTTPGQITVSAYPSGLTAGTYSCVIKVTANGTTKRVYVVLVVARGGDDGGEHDDSSVVPFHLDPGGASTADAAWMDGYGVPVASKNDPTSQGLVLTRNPTASTAAIAGVVLKGATGTQLSQLSFDLRSDSECSARAPQFVVVTADEIVHRGSCANGTIQSLSVSGWQRVSFDPANARQLSPAVAPGTAVKTIALVMDQPVGSGMAVLDNINLNGRYIGRQ